jgi:hypothetical protein
MYGEVLVSASHIDCVQPHNPMITKKSKTRILLHFHICFATNLNVLGFLASFPAQKGEGMLVVLLFFLIFNAGLISIYSIIIIIIQCLENT